jgi:hypothetical protein
LDSVFNKVINFISMRDYSSKSHHNLTLLGPLVGF